MKTYTEERRRITELASKKIKEAAMEIIVALQDLCLYGCAEIDETHSGNNVKIIFQDQSLLRQSQQPSGQTAQQIHTQGQNYQVGSKSRCYKQDPQEWYIQIENTLEGNIYQMNISRASSSTEEPYSGLE